MYDTSPTLYAPIAGDNGPGIKALIEAGKRWIQVNGAACPIESRIVVTDGGVPAHGLWIEPAPGIDRVLIDVSGIGRDPDVPTNPSYSAFEYPGLQAQAGYLTAPAAVGDRTITVNNGALYTAGAWIFLSDTSTNPGYLLPLDGPMESRQVLSRAGNVLTLDEPLRRAHAANVIAALHQPIMGVRMRGLRFTGNAAGGIHLHSAHGAIISDVDSVDWRGRFMVLLDNGGRGNLIDTVFCQGTEPGAGPTQNAWGVAMEGQEDTRSVRSGGTLCGNGHLMNYCTDTVATDVVAYANNVNDNINYQSLRCYSLRPRTALAAVAETLVSNDCVDCAIIGRLEYIVPPAAADQYLDPRTLPVSPLAGADRLLGFDENGAGKQVPRNTLVSLDEDGSYPGEAFEVKSPGNGGGSLRASNAIASWLMGMLSANGSKDWLLFDLLSGAIRLSVSATSGEVDVPGSLIVHGNLAMEASSGVYIGGNKVLGAQRPATADLASGATLADVIAKVNLILGDERGHGSRAS